MTLHLQLVFHVLALTQTTAGTLVTSHLLWSTDVETSKRCESTCDLVFICSSLWPFEIVTLL